MLEARAACKEALWQGMMTWMQERERKWDTHHEDDKLLGVGIMNMIAKTMQGVAQGQEASERERQMTASTDGGWLEALQHAHMTRE